eukprot:gene5945-33521_t
MIALQIDMTQKHRRDDNDEVSNKYLEEYDAGLREDASAARAFCNYETFGERPCGWASEEERTKNLANQCPFCGTYWSGEPRPPTELTSHFSYYQLTSDYTGNCAAARLGEPDQTVTRCELLVPEGSEQDEIERVASSSGVNCKACHPCDEAVQDTSKGYTPTIMSLTMNADVKIYLAKFEICSDAACLDVAYEETKAKGTP